MRINRRVGEFHLSVEAEKYDNSSQEMVVDDVMLNDCSLPSNQSEPCGVGEVRYVAVKMVMENIHIFF